MPRQKRERKRASSGTSTSAFGSPGRSSHDASSFYNSQLYAGLSHGDPPQHLENSIPLSGLDQIFCATAESMAEIPDNAIHLMVTSPPYNVGKLYDQDLTLDAYLDFLRRVWREVYRVLVPGGRACINVANLGRKPYIPLHAYMVMEMQALGFLMRGEIIWNKAASASPSTAWGSWRSPSNPTLRDVHEYILVFCKGSFQRKNPAKRQATIQKEAFLEWTRSVWTFPAESARKIGHPAPFPVELPRRLIELYTFAGEVILDPFMGSGQTALAALQSGRHYVGYEIDPDYVALADARIRECMEVNMTELSVDQVIANLPPVVRAAIEAHDAAAFQCALDELPAEQVQRIVQQLEAVGIVGPGLASEVEFQDMLQEFDLLIRAIVAVAHGDESQRSQVVEVLPRLDEAGYHLENAIQRLWSGERRASVLIAGLDPNSARLVEDILRLLDGEEQKLPSVDPETLVETIPAEVLSAIHAQDEGAFRQAMDRLSPADRQFVAAQLAELQAQADAEAEAWLANLPPNVRDAVRDQNEQCLQAALKELPPGEAQEILEQLEAVGWLEETDVPETDLLMTEFEPLVLAVVSVARGNASARPQLEALLADLDEQGWHLCAVVQRIWAGERDDSALCKDLDRQDEQIVRCILEHLG
jgi:modification methylase